MAQFNRDLAQKILIHDYWALIYFNERITVIATINVALKAPNEVTQLYAFNQWLSSIVLNNEAVNLHFLKIKKWHITVIALIYITLVLKISWSGFFVNEKMLAIFKRSINSNKQ